MPLIARRKRKFPEWWTSYLRLQKRKTIPQSPPIRAIEGSGTEAGSATESAAKRLEVRATKLLKTNKNLWVHTLIVKKLGVTKDISGYKILQGKQALRE